MKLGLSFLALFLASVGTSNAKFNPRTYQKQVAQCKTTRRDGKVVDISLRYVDINPTAKNVIMMVHGWPSLWSTWSNQIEGFGNDYHLIVPDLRGFGESTHPGPTARDAGSMPELVGDLVCILEKAGVREAVCMGHDWGSALCYEAARARPDIFTSVIGVAVPYIPAGGPFVPPKHLLSALPKLAYQVYFDSKTDEAIAELNKDIRRTIRATLRTVDSAPPDAYLRSVDSFLGAYGDVAEIPPVPFMDSNEEAYFVEQYAIQGFDKTLQFYMRDNRYAAWEIAHNQGNHTISQPVLAVYPTADPVADWSAAARILKSHDYLPSLTNELMEGAHWPHIEYPEKFNKIARKWLDELFAGKGEHIIDEL